MDRMKRRHVLIGVGVVVGLAALALGVFAAFGGIDPVSRERAAGEGTQVVEVRLVDQALGFDIQPDVVEIEKGTHVVLDVVNDAEGAHDLTIDSGRRTKTLEPGESERLDLGTVDAEHDAWCGIGNHKIGGMTLDLRLVDPS
jgi:uncharacterized cupredoxin-like copper-binding protein